MLCSSHFLSDDYYINVHGNKCLNSTAVPSQFSFTKTAKQRTTTNSRKVIDTDAFSKPSTYINLKPVCSESICEITNASISNESTGNICSDDDQVEPRQQATISRKR